MSLMVGPDPDMRLVLIMVIIAAFLIGLGGILNFIWPPDLDCSACVCKAVLP